MSSTFLGQLEYEKIKGSTVYAIDPSLELD